MKNKSKLLVLVALHLGLMIYSISGIFSKLAAETPFLSIEFCVYYAGLIAILGVYSIIWQQILKRMPLTIAFANKAITVLWGIIWGILFFNESISFSKFVGALIIIIGIILYSTDKEVID